MNSSNTKSVDYSLWSDTAAGALRTAFGLIWALDAYLKWRPVFFDNYLRYVTDVAKGQPLLLVPWFNMWVGIISLNPNLFAWLTRLIETAIALGLLLGIARKWTYLLGGIFALFIWSIPQGFGGPYAPGATDVDSGLLYALVFCAFIVMDYVLGRSPYSIDFYLEKRYPNWRYISEWAPALVLDKEPRHLPRNIQIATIIGIIVMLAIFITIIGSEMNAAAAQPAGSIPNMLQIVSTHYFWF